MSALATLKEAAKCGVRVSLNGDSLALKAGTKPPPDLLAKLRTHKAEVVALLRKEACAARPTEPDLVELEERMGMAMDSVPEPYLDAWRRLKCQRPMAVSDLAWRQAIYVAGRLFDAFTIPLFEQFQWTPGDIFDVPHDGKAGGLVRFCAGETVRSLGPEHAAIMSGRVFDRLTRAEWINPYHRKDDAR